MPQRPAGRTAFVLNAALSVTLLGLVAAVAVVVRAPSPPGIAEFAPQASRPIVKAPLGQSAQHGSGEGSIASPSPSPRPRSVAGAVGGVLRGVPSALQCYTWADGSVTQTADPQSAPCVASWPEAAKGNGGATSPGVTASTIRVALPSMKDSPGVAQLQHLVDYINSRYELYGRTLQLVPFSSQQVDEAYNDVSFADPQAQRADAVQAASLNVFAAVDFLDQDPNVLTLPTYLDTLASRGVISVVGGENVSMATQQQLVAHAPYEWSYSPTLGELFTETARMTCAQLVGHPAHAGTQFAGSLRKFALLVPDQRTTGIPLDGVSQMLSVLAGCGVKSPEVVEYSGAKARSSSLAAKYAQLRSQGITSVLYMPWLDQGDPTTSQQGLARQSNYRPEWITVGWMPFATAALMYTKANQPGATFGIGAWSRYLDLPATPWRDAFTAAGGTGDTGLIGANGVYHSLLLIAAGVQMAGPRLTPQSFAAALHATTFPNPGAGRAPSYQAAVAFANGQPTMTHDYLGFWIDPGATLTDFNTAGRDNNYSQIFCSVDGGARWAQSWPAVDRFYKGSCR